MRPNDDKITEKNTRYYFSGGNMEVQILWHKSGVEQVRSCFA
jgi:hypothetical protein